MPTETAAALLWPGQIEVSGKDYTDSGAQWVHWFDLELLQVSQLAHCQVSHLWMHQSYVQSYVQIGWLGPWPER